MAAAPYSPDAERSPSYDVLVSYTRADEAERDEVCAALSDRGYAVLWDGRLGGGYWRAEWQVRARQSKLVLVLWSAKAAASQEVGVEAAGALALEKLLSVPLEGRDAVPKPYREVNHHELRRGADAPTRARQLAAILAKVEQLAGPPPRQGTPGEATIPVDLGNIPAAPDKLIGREREMQLLRDAWASRAPAKVNAVVLSALGGAGKSALLRAFVNERLAAGGDGAARIYGWSAYSQGSGAEKRADADGFISKALTDFGYAGPPITDAVQRARTLAGLIQRQRVLLLLDGLEPLQDPPGVNKGRFKDKGLAALVRALGNANPGLVVLTSRQEVPELEGAGRLVRHHPLDELTPAAGAELLVELGVTGRQRELEQAVADVEGHALSVTLLGTYLAEVHGGHIRHRDQFDFANLVLTPEEIGELATDRTIRPAKRAAKVMAGYLEQFEKLAQDGASAGLGGPERALLHLLGLFDRPADGPAVDALLAGRIPGLTDELFVEPVEKRFLGIFKRMGVRDLTPGEHSARLREAKSRLRKLRLLARANRDDPHELDAHPVVRAYFASRLSTTAAEAATAAHDILYRHYAAAAPDLPDTLDEMQPLFHAVQHGVKAGRVQEAYDEVFRRRMDRGNKAFMPHSLGAFGALLAIFAHFFEAPWRTPHPALRPDDRAWLLSSAAFALTALGRLSDSVAPRQASLDAYIADKNWAFSGVVGGELTDTLLTLGRVGEAVTTAEQAVAHADLSQDGVQRELRRTNLANALTAAGQPDGAAALFAEAEAINLASTPRQPQLCSLQGYWYGDLILARGDAADALARGRYQLDLAERYLGKGLGLHDIGFGHLLIGRALDALGDTGAAAALDAAVAGLRRAGREDRIPEALLARAAHRRRRVAAGEMDLLGPLREDLAEVADIAGDEMRLHLADLALETARLALDAPAAFATPATARAEAEALTRTATRLVAETGYHRRDSEVAELRRRLATLPAPAPSPLT